MGRNRRLNTHFWNDTFIAALEKDQKLLYVYLITSPLGNMLGVYEIHPRRIAFDTRLDKDTITEGLKAFERAGKAKYVHGHIIMTNFVKNQNYNKNMKKSAAKVIPKLPQKVLNDPFFIKVWDQFQNLPYAREILKEEGVTIGSRNQIETGGQNKQEEEPENDSDLFDSKWRTRGVPVPEPLQIEGFVERYEEYWDYMMESRKMRSSLSMVESQFRRLIELKEKGNDPLKVIEQTINAGNKSFYPLKDQEFESKKNSNGSNGHKSRTDQTFDAGEELIGGGG
ncbi:hypothetical protein [Fodinibius sp.]|uniref:hypothetical protein n=1 Tax=Fodinibius sp. TaxID=1872440 RepID=UPI002ACEC049|nr:hypothetical protein [Fodinibius sp.]MDZ7658050.1 hypothetical protein [Fodinibius sp.]